MKKLLNQMMWEMIGSIFVAVGIYNFALFADFPLTGFSGIALIIYRLFNIPVGISTILLNVPVAVLCYKFLGRKIFISSFRCMLISSLMIDYLAPLFPVYDGDRLLAALCTGVLGGIGYALIYSHASSTGGMDFVIMTIKVLQPHISLGKIILALDVVIIFIGGLLFSDLDGIIYGTLVSYLFALVADKVMYGLNSGKVALIVTERGEELCHYIDESTRRGSTILSASGGYRGDKKQVVMCASNSKEMYRVIDVVKDKDPQAFMVIVESHEVHGEGFNVVQIGSSE